MSNRKIAGEFLLFFFIIGSFLGCRKAIDIEKAKQNPRDVLLESLKKSLNHNLYRINSKATRTFYLSEGTSIFVDTEILEHILEPDSKKKSDKWHSKFVYNVNLDGKSGFYEAFEVAGILYQKGFSDWRKSEGSIKNDGELINFFMSANPLEFSLKKADVTFTGEENQDGSASAVFEYIAPGPYRLENPKQKVWVALYDGLVRKILIEGSISSIEKISMEISFSYDDKDIKIDPPI